MNNNCEIIHLDSLTRCLDDNSTTYCISDNFHIPEYYHTLVNKFLDIDKNYNGEKLINGNGIDLYQRNRFLRYIYEYFESKSKKYIIEGLQIFTNSIIAPNTDLVEFFKNKPLILIRVSALTRMVRNIKREGYYPNLKELLSIFRFNIQRTKEDNQLIEEFLKTLIEQ